MTRLVAVADAVADVMLDVPALPARGGDVLATRAAVVAGGCGLNVLIAATRQGLPGVYAGTHGTGPFGDLARAALVTAGIALAHPAEPDLDTGFTVALVEPDAERTFVTSVGAEARLDATRLGRVDVQATDAVYVSGYDLAYPGTGPAMARWLADLPPSCLVVVDPGPLVGEIPSDLLAGVAARADWLTCTATEATRLTGEADPQRAVRALATQTRCGGVLRLGAAGCLVAERHQVASIEGLAVEALDTNGAGDAHTGVFLAEIVAGQAPVAAAVRANAAAALSVTRRGPATAPTAEELDAFLRKRGMSGYLPE